jgi:uncharacterized protein (DUF2062 family)
MGIVPLWGFQMLIAIAIAILFKLNKGLVLIAANISFPPFIPVILYLSHITGKIWMGENAITLSFDKGFDLETMYNSFLQYVLGAITFSLVAGLFCGFITFLLLTVSKRNRENG